MNIRPLQPRDFEAWVRMRHELWPDDDIAELREHAARMLAGDPRPFLQIQNFVAEDETGIHGFIEASQRAYAEGCNSSPVGYIEGWYVSGGKRAIGVGRALVQAAEEWARAQGCTEMASDAHLDNETSRKAHRALGYAEQSPAINFCKKL